MSDTILSGDFTIYYTNDTGGDKQIKWTGSATDTRTVNELYSAIQNLFDDDTAGSGDQMGEGIPMSAQTPTQYTIGKIEINDSEPWFIDEETVTHLTGGSITTIGWNRSTGTNTGIVEFPYTIGAGTDFDATDIGKTVTHSVGLDSGTLLDFHVELDGDLIAVIRPDSSAAANDWDSTGATVAVTGGTGAGLSQTIAADSGESIWANIYSIGTLVANTNIYIYQNGVTPTSWWSIGHIDILVMVQELGTMINNGFVSVYARQYSKLYDHFISDASSGGRNPVPLAISNDVNNDSGYYNASFTGGNGSTLAIDDVISVSGTTLAVVTDVTSGGAASGSFEYYLIGDLTNLADTDSFTASPSGKTGTISGAPTSLGPAISPSTTLTVDFAAISRDLLNGNGNQPYSVELNLLDSITVDVLYERLKYLTRRGQTTNIDTESGQSLVGQEYVGIGDIILNMQTDGTFTEGQIATGTTSQATGVITANHASNPYYLVLRDMKGTFDDAETVTDPVTGSATTAASNAVETLSPIKFSPFGTFAGGKFFGARGVWLANVPAADATNFQLIDTFNEEQIPPQSIPITISNTLSGDRVAVFKTTGDNETIDKNQFTLDASQIVGVAYVRIDESAPADTPSSGVLRVVRRNASGAILGEDRYTYSSWTYTTYTEFTLDVSDHPSGASDAYDTDDTVYVPYVDVQATGTTVSQSITYVSDRYVLVRARNVGILPFKIKGQITSSGLPATVIRNSDSIYQ